MDFRETLLDAESAEWAALVRGRETSQEAYQLFDGLDIMVERSPFGPGVILKRWNGARWSPLSPVNEDDTVVEQSAYLAISEFRTAGEGWHVLTGPGVISPSTGEENPYCLLRPMLLPAFLMRLPEGVPAGGVRDILKDRYLAGVIVRCVNKIGCFINDDFAGQANLTAMLRMA